MNEIRSMRLVNFQGYKDSTIDFTRGFNVITGDTDSGKSTVSRALLLVLENTPITYEEFVRIGETFFEVTLEFVNGTQIVRGRASGENYYKVVYADGTINEHRGFGYSVPLEVQDACGIPSLKIDDDKYILNILQQFDPTFMFSESAGRRARMIGALAGSEAVDGSIGVVNSWHRESKAEITAYKKTLKEKKAVAEKLAPVQGLRAILNSASQHLEGVNGKVTLVERLEGLLLKSSELDKEIRISRAIMAFELDILSLEELSARIRESAHTASQIEQLIGRVKALETSLKEHSYIAGLSVKMEEISSELDKVTGTHSKLCALKASLSTFEDLTKKLKAFDEVGELDTDGLYSLLSALEGKVKEAESLRSALTALQEISARCEKGQSVIDTLQGELESLEDKYKNALVELGECPFCHNIVKEGVA